METKTLDMLHHQLIFTPFFYSISIFCESFNKYLEIFHRKKIYSDDLWKVETCLQNSKNR